MASASEARSHVGDYLGMLHRSEEDLAEALERVADHHAKEPDVPMTCRLLASWSRRHVEELRPLADRYPETKSDEPDRLRQALFHGPRHGGIGLLRDLHDLWLLAGEVHVCWEVLAVAAKMLDDRDLLDACKRLGHETDRQVAWLRTHIDRAAPRRWSSPREPAEGRGMLFDENW